VTVAHSRSRQLDELCRTADVLFAAVGRLGLVRGSWVRPGACVIDVGINRLPPMGGKDDKGRLVGDVDYASAVKVAGAITPVPGGVGPMTIACLLRNTLQAACAATGVTFPLR
jgi:methylenetetrahydrofolate dehydrogenase (NADP+)/methenyltetrahydrofolate cyclohydrolase